MSGRFVISGTFSSSLTAASKTALMRVSKDLVSGLDGVIFNDLMENIEWFFNLHDKNKDGYLTKDEVLTLSESFLVRRYLISKFQSVSFFAVHFPI